MEIITAKEKQANSFLSFYENARTRPLFFILGAQGSGTNLLCSILKKIFNFSTIRDQSLIFNSAVNIYKNHSDISVEFRKVILKFFPGPVTRRLSLRHYHHRTQYYVGIEAFFNEVKIKNAEDFAYFFYAYHCFSEAKNYIAIKSDDIWEQLTYLDKIFSNYRIIFLTRDCRDNVLSVMRKNFAPKSVYFASKYIKRRMVAYFNEALKHPDLSFQIKYEELLTNPKSFVKKFASSTGVKPSDDIDKHLDELNIRRTNFQKWKAMFNEEELLICETILKDELDVFGYSMENKSFSKISTLQILSEILRDTMFRIPQKLRVIFWSMIKG